MTTAKSQQTDTSVEDSFHAQDPTAKRLAAGEPSPQQTLDRIVASVRTAIPECVGAGILLTSARGQERAVTDQKVAHCEEAQTELGEGPGLETGEHLVCSADLTVEERWPAWSEDVTGKSEFRSVLALSLIASTDRGILTLYAREPGVFTPDVQRAAVGFAALAEAALEASWAIEQLRKSVESHVLIGQAQGIIMERFNTNADQALLMLEQISVDSNLRIRELAHETITLRSFPTGGRNSQRANIRR